MPSNTRGTFSPRVEAITIQPCTSNHPSSPKKYSTIWSWAKICHSFLNSPCCMNDKVSYSNVTLKYYVPFSQKSDEVTWKDHRLDIDYHRWHNTTIVSASYPHDSINWTKSRGPRVRLPRMFFVGTIKHKQVKLKFCNYQPRGGGKSWYSENSQISKKCKYY